MSSCNTWTRISSHQCHHTGTLEIGGLTSIQGLEIVRGAKGLNIVGCDLVEVSAMRQHAYMDQHVEEKKKEGRIIIDSSKHFTPLGTENTNSLKMRLNCY